MEFLKESHQQAKEKGYILAVKLVRGAYMEKERERAEEMNYPSPIHETKPPLTKILTRQSNIVLKISKKSPLLPELITKKVFSCSCKKWKKKEFLTIIRTFFSHSFTG